jgi:outer membrane protein OmpA-like peptidoglycan-associated protein
MNLRPLPLILVFAALLSLPFPARAEPSATLLKVLTEDAKGAKDSKLTGRYEGSFIVGQTTKDFDELTLPSGPAEGADYDSNRKFTATITAHGKVTRTLYVAPEGRSSLEVFSNFLDALREKGYGPAYECAKDACGPSFKVLKYAWDNPSAIVRSEGADNDRKAVSDAMFDRVIDPRYALMKLGDGEEAAYVAVFAAQNQGGTFGDVSQVLQNRVGVLVEIVDPKAREKKMVTLSAEDIGNEIGENGKVILYGVLFDFDKATIKPESQPQLDEMARYLTENADRKVYIVGHTDNQGKLDYNLKLSAARAASVAKALAAAGVDAARMVAKGVGPLVPVASNADEEGQAKNRRVELVEQ